MAGWLHGIFMSVCWFILPCCGFSLSLVCRYIVDGTGLSNGYSCKCMITASTAEGVHGLSNELHGITNCTGSRSTASRRVQQIHLP